MRYVLFMAAGVVAATAALADPPDRTRLPLGDGKISDQPQKGYVWACHTDPNGRGAQVDGPWIDKANGTFDKTMKAVVEGAVEWPGFFSIGIENGQRAFTTNDLPADYTTGVFPISPDSQAYQYDRNRSRIGEQDMWFDVPADPVLLDEARCVPGAVGILLSGVVLFNALDAPGRDAVAHETQDACDGHPQGGSVYHNHSVSSCLLASIDKGTGQSALVGYALDGFGIYGPRDENGVELSSDDLDECHGRVSEVEWDGKMVNMYHYVATADYPYTVGCMRGAYDNADVMAISGPAAREDVTGAPGPGAAPNLDVASAALGLTTEALTTALGPPPPDFADAAAKLGIDEQVLRQALGVR